jgi:hypothetical protein
VHGGSGNQALDFALAHRTVFFVGRVEALYLFKTMAASLAAIFVKRHSVLLLLL